MLSCYPWSLCSNGREGQTEDDAAGSHGQAQRKGLDSRLLNSVDWTLEELAEFLEVQQEQMRADN